MMQKKYDITSIIEEYSKTDDFGFTAEDDSDYEAVIAEKEETVEEYKARLNEVEKLILPFLSKLLKTADQPIIKWPNRKATIEAQIQKILNLTRG
jgi:CRISPR/Cas system CMR-associated protein Cmr1 (group 7 of RAMP superfamily)